METKIQLLHPEGKKAVSMTPVKYEQMKAAVMHAFPDDLEVNHTQMLQSVHEYFDKNSINFEGSLDWHFEWVKLDLEARKVIIRSNSKPARYLKAKPVPGENKSRNDWENFES